MSAPDAKAIADAIRNLTADLNELAKTGAGIPTIEKNVTRMRGALRQLEVQFIDLEEVSGNG